MATLSFDIKDVKRIYSFIKNDDNAKILVVKDEGVYLMGTSDLTKGKSSSELNLLTYIDKYNPNKNEDWYEHARYDLGGDDFFQEIPLDWFELFFKEKPNARKFSINFGKMRMSLKI